MELFDINIVQIIICLSVTSLLNYMIFKNVLFSFFDPYVFIPIHQSFVLGYILYAFVNDKIMAEHFYYVSISYIAFVLGLYSCKIFDKERIITKSLRQIPNKQLIFNIVLIIGLQIIIDIFLIINRGVPAFTLGGDNITFYAGGLGIIHFLHIGISLLLPILAFEALIVYKQKKLFFLFIAFMIYSVMIIGGSKSGFLNLFFLFYLTVNYFKRYGNIVFKTQKKYIITALVLLSLIVCYKFYSIVSTGYESSTVLAIIKRLINTADAIYYYFERGAYAYFDQNLSILSYTFSQITPYVGFKDEYAINIGLLLTEYAMGFSTPGYGPNPQMYGIGHIAWGNFGFIYCFFIGFVLSVIKFRPNRNFLVYAVLYTIAPTLIGDGTLFVLYLFYVALLSPVLLLSFLMYHISRRDNGNRMINEYSLKSQFSRVE